MAGTKGSMPPSVQTSAKALWEREAGLLGCWVSLGNSSSDSQEPAVLGRQWGRWPRKLLALGPLGQAERRAGV